MTEFYDENKNNEMENKSENKILKRILGYGFLFVFIYFLVSCTLNMFGFSFRSWIVTGIFFLFISLIILGSITLWYKSFSGSDGIGVKIFISIAILFFSGFILMLSLFGYASFSRMETLAYRHGKLVIASADGFLDTFVNFYEPVGGILMKKTNIKEVWYGGCFNAYEFSTINSDVVSDKNINLGGYVYSLMEFKPYIAEQTFGGISYKGNETYTFNNGITMKFNENETVAKSFSTTSSIASYDNIKIVGNNIKSFEQELLNKVSGADKTVEFSKNTDGYNVLVIGKQYNTLELNMNLYVNNVGIIDKVEVVFE